MNNVRPGPPRGETPLDYLKGVQATFPRRLGAAVGDGGVRRSDDQPEPVRSDWARRVQVAGVSALVGMGIGVGGQPIYGWKIRSQQAGPNTTAGDIYRAMVRGGLQEVFKGGKIAMVKSGAIQTVKGGLYAVTDDMNLDPVQKAAFFSFVLATAITPLDRLASAYIGNRNVSLLEVGRTVWGQGVSSIYKGYGVSLGNKFLEAGFVYGFNEWRKSRQGVEGSRSSLKDWIVMTFGATAGKIILTNWLDVSKAEIQKSIKAEGKAMTVPGVLRAKGARHFFLAGAIPRGAMVAFGMAGNYAALALNDWLKGE